MSRATQKAPPPLSTRAAPATLALMVGCDLGVMTSTDERLPQVVLAAMSLGLPVIATAVGATPKVVEDGLNGRLLPADAPAALAVTRPRHVRHHRHLRIR